MNSVVLDEVGFCLKDNDHLSYFGWNSTFKKQHKLRQYYNRLSYSEYHSVTSDDLCFRMTYMEYDFSFLSPRSNLQCKLPILQQKCVSMTPF